MNMRRRRRVPLAPYLFVLPFLAIFVGFALYPMGFALRLSFTNWRGAGLLESVGLANYRYLLTSEDFWGSLGVSAVLWLLVVPLQVVLALAIAVALNRARLRGLFIGALVAPFVTPLVAMSQVWIVLFDKDFGAVNSALTAAGLPAVGWLTDPTWAKPTLALLVLWRTTGYAVVLLLAGLQSIPPEVYEAARLDGAGAWTQFWRVTLPLAMRTISFYVVIATLTVFQLFAEPYVVTDGGPFNSTRTAGLYLYGHITNSDLGLGAANSFLLVILVFGLSLASIRILRPREDS
ncbi:MAG: sugar ABC transporter permease [Hamadaea sp.]|uniref:carbohydrate ABC transporter permease n=1 Tax=Hamadaea sp. TaxID=2024425 RepID=UPI0017CBCAC6|nr:sugar ABC transporter permease [Hamadaea sp.]NUR73863.1 sugar ABC transporter permease [Hamadaea sp.]NUT18972.1 sugar ABC transporter permease [Hamadaea sp.]